MNQKTVFPLICLAFMLCLAIGSLTCVYGKTRALSRSRLRALDDDARLRLKSALREMRRRGIQPRVNSTFRSSSEQRALYRCARSTRCRARRGIYGAQPPGASMHEAGLAVDLGGVANRRRLTPKGRQMVRIMRRHGFSWRYGLKDPAHFEMSPQRAGYNSRESAIKAGQRRWRKTVKTRRVASSNRLL
ncbi:MAG: M15 family metallopeptidase [Blastocatellia bacterium]|nr:M15 family metallopeptidase [Blastocatellia bacterium]